MHIFGETPLSSTKRLLNNIPNSGTNHQSTLPRPNNVPWSPPLPLPFNWGHTFRIFKNKFLFTIPVSTLAQQGNEGHAETPDFKVSGVNVVCMPVPQKICHPSVVYSFIFCCLVAGGLMVSKPFQGFLCFKQRMIQTIPKTTVPVIVTVRSRIKVKRGKSYSKADLSKSEMERSGILQSALILWDLSIWGGGEKGEGYWLWKFSQFCLLINTGGGLD